MKRKEMCDMIHGVYPNKKMEDINMEEKKPDSEVIDVQDLANKWMEAQARMCDVILALVRKSQ